MKERMCPGCKGEIPPANEYACSKCWNIASASMHTIWIQMRANNQKSEADRRSAETATDQAWERFIP